MAYEAQNKEHQENVEKNLRDSGCGNCYSAKSEHRGDERHDKKSKCHSQHHPLLCSLNLDIYCGALSWLCISARHDSGIFAFYESFLHPQMAVGDRKSRCSSAHRLPSSTLPAFADESVYVLSSRHGFS
jgi:hypothetical protein